MTNGICGLFDGKLMKLSTQIPIFCRSSYALPEKDEAALLILYTGVATGNPL